MKTISLVTLGLLLRTAAGFGADEPKLVPPSAVVAPPVASGVLDAEFSTKVQSIQKSVTKSLKKELIEEQNPPFWILNMRRQGRVSYTLYNASSVQEVTTVGLRDYECQRQIGPEMMVDRSVAHICYGAQAAVRQFSMPDFNWHSVYFVDSLLGVELHTGKVNSSEISPASSSVYVEDILEIPRPRREDNTDVIFAISPPRPAFTASETKDQKPAASQFLPWDYMVQIYNGSESKLIGSFRLPPAPEGVPIGSIAAKNLSAEFPDNPSGVGPGQLFRVVVIAQGRCLASNERKEALCGAKVTYALLLRKNR